jgi:hypothetical protein
MAQIIVSASAPVKAPPAVVYGILADYRDGHPHILPRPHFGALVVESGGTGAGTVFTVQARQGMKMHTFRMRVTEPEPGRVLVETDADPESDLVSTFTVNSAAGGQSHVTITSRWTRGGVRGLIERLLVPPLAGRIYLREIANLERLARERAGRPRA